MVQVTDYDWEDSGIYVIRNKINGKEYVGKSKQITKRNQDELSALRNDYFHNKHLQSSFNRYGEENFEIETIKHNICPGLLGAHEILQIAIRGTDEPEIGYNKTWGGEGCLGHKPSEESNKKRSEAMTGRKKSKEHCENISKGRKGIIFTDEHCENISKTKKRMFDTGELVQWNKGKKCPQLTGENNGMYGVSREAWNKGIEWPEMRGENHHQAKINEDGARKIKILKKTTNMTYQQIADCVPNATKAIVGTVVRGEKWKHVKIDEDDD